jgi:DNA-binding NarL/FixJ family response regulator
MFKTKLILLSGPGSITETIIDLFPPKFEVKVFYWDGNNLQNLLTSVSSHIQETEICLLNLSHVSENSGDIFRNIYRDYSEKLFIVLHHYQQKAFAEAFIDMGASAYLPINFQSDELFKAISSVLNGKKFVSKYLK